MKKINFKSFLLSVSLFVLFFGVLFFGSKPLEAKLQDFKPLVQIPGLESSMSVGEVTGKNMDMVKSTLLRDYILGIYDYSFAIAGILAAIVLMGGGVLWLISGGSPDKIAKAKKIIGSSLIGLVLLFGSRLILNTINPELIKMKALVFPGIEDKHPDLAIGCCQCSLTDKTWRLFDIKLDGSTICDSSAGLTQKKCDEFCLDQAWKSVEARKKISFKNFTNLWAKSDAVNTFKYDHVCGSGEYENFCVPIEDSEIHPNGFISGRWDFQEGVKRQIGDMSKELADVLNCMSLKLPENFKGQISTISDAKYIGNLKACDDEDCEENAKKCTHPCQSCHYGGGTGSGVSYAVNFSDKANLKIYEKAIDYCDKNYYIKAHPIDNPTHVHLSIGKCPVN